MNMGCMYLFELWFSPGICPGVGLLSHTVVWFEEYSRIYFCNQRRLFRMGRSQTSNKKHTAFYLPLNTIQQSLWAMMPWWFVHVFMGRVLSWDLLLSPPDEKASLSFFFLKKETKEWMFWVVVPCFLQLPETQSVNEH